MAALLAGCAATTAKAGADAAVDPALERAIARLYAAFCFDAAGEPDWAQLRELCAEQASFVAPIAPGRAPSFQSREPFLETFGAWARSPEMAQGLHERVLAWRGERHGAVAHTWVEFEGFVPATRARRTLGIDTIQWVRDGERWRVASFATHYSQR